MKTLRNLCMMMCMAWVLCVPSQASTTSYFTGDTIELVLTEGYTYQETTLKDSLYNGEGSDIVVNDFYLEGENADCFALATEYSAININQYKKLTNRVFSPFYVFFLTEMTEGLYTCDLVVDTEAGEFRSTFTVTVQDPLTMTPNDKIYFTSYENTKTLKSGYDYTEQSLQDNLYNGTGTKVAVHDFYLEGKDAEYFAFSSANSASNINKTTTLGLSSSSRFYVFLDLGMPAGTYTCDLVVVTEEGAYRSTFTATVLGDTTSSDSNTGDSNTSDSNKGDSNTGDSTSSDSNTSDSNTGDSNTGDSNSSDSNSSDSNSSDSNTGDSNTGDSNTGDSNSSDSNSIPSGTGTGMAYSSRDTSFYVNEDGSYDVFRVTGYNLIYSLDHVEDLRYFYACRFDSDFQLLWKKEIPRELTEIIGVYMTEQYNFLLVGEENYQESNASEILRVIKYDKEWVRLGSASLYGANTVDIDDQLGNRSYFLYGNLLYIHTDHGMYKSNDGKNHQANMTVVVNIETMTVVDSRTNIGFSDEGYVSHALEQEILVDSQGYMVTLDRGDSYPRGAYIYRSLVTDNDPMASRGTGVSLTTWPGNSGSINTGSNVMGLVETSQGYITCILDRNTSTTVGGKDYTDAYLYFISKTDFSSNSIIVNSFSGYNFTGAEKISYASLLPTSSEGGYVLLCTYAGDYPYTFERYLATYNATGGMTPLQKVTWSNGVDYTENFANLQWIDGKIVTVDSSKLEQDTTTVQFVSLNTNGLASFYTYDEVEEEEEEEVDDSGIVYREYTSPNQTWISTFAPLNLANATPWAHSLVTSAYNVGLLYYATDVMERCPYDITRVEFCRLVMQVYKRTYGTYPVGPNPFTDTTNEDVIAAYTLGIVGGTTPTTFSPNANITRQELAVMVLRTAECMSRADVSTSSSTSFNDHSSIAYWAVEAAAFAQNKGYLAGSNGNFRPTDNLTCEEAIVVAYRLFSTA